MRLRPRVAHAGTPLALLAALGCAPHAPRPAMPAADPRGTAVSTDARPFAGEVLVVLVVDQLGSWTLEERLAGLPADGGFHRLVREGRPVERLELQYATTDTALGHATIATGRWPVDTGIVANTTVDDHGTETSFLLDPEARLVTPEGAATRASSSLRRLRVETFADRARARAPETRIVSLSMKDRGALFGGGRSPDAVLWYDGREDAFVTSTALSVGYPAWARAHGAREHVASRRASPWTVLDPAFVTAHTRLPDDAPGEGDVGGFGTVFPHDFAASSRTAMAFLASPRGDELLVELALDAVDALHRPSAPTVLFVSLSSHDYVGHVFGPESWESLDTLRRLDGQLARLFAGLDARVGPSRWSAVLTADHGASIMPESDLARAPWCAPGFVDPFERPCAGAVRVDTEAFEARLEAAAAAVLGAGDYVLGVASPYVRLTERARALPPIDRARLDAALVAALEREPGVDEALSLVAGHACTEPSARTRPLCRSVDASAGDLTFTLRDEAFTDSTYVRGDGGGHGAPSAADRLVPLLVRAPGRALRVDAALQGDAPRPLTVVFSVVDRLLGGDGVPNERAWPHAPSDDRGEPPTQ